MSSKEEKFIISKSDVRVYTRPEYHPFLKGTDLTHKDFLRKMKKVFPNNIANGLPRICSDNSEDARTWYYFSPLLKAPWNVKKKWLVEFLETALQRRLNIELIKHLGSMELLFWRGREEKPYYEPPPSLGVPEGRTEVDLSIRVPPYTMIFVEAKYKSEISFDTKHSVDRDQIIRNIDVGTHFAKKNNFQEFYFILLASPENTKSTERLYLYKKNPEKILSALPHRTDLCETLKELTKRLGYLTWDQLPTPISQ